MPPNIMIMYFIARLFRAPVALALWSERSPD